LPLADSCDINDAAQLDICIKGIGHKCNITEELVVLSPIKGTTKRCDIANAVFSTLVRYNLKSENLYGVLTDGVLAMVGKNGGDVPQIRKEASLCDLRLSPWLQYVVITLG
jgi:hypothetical protein